MNMEMSSEIKDMAGAMAAAQAEITTASKDRLNPHFKQSYATLASVWEACRVALTKNGISVVQSPTANGAQLTLTTVLMHKSGQWFRDTLSLTARDASPQSVGSAITYARRYALAAMVSVAPDDDDDGNSAQPAPQAARVYEAPKPVAPPAVPDEIKTAWRKLRAAANKSFGEAKTPADMESKRKGLEDYSKQGANLWAMLTHHNETETFGMLSRTHMDRVARDNPSTVPEAWRDAVSRANMDRFPFFQEQYTNTPELHTQENSDALTVRGRELGLEEYAEVDA